MRIVTHWWKTVMDNLHYERTIEVDGTLEFKQVLTFPTPSSTNATLRTYLDEQLVNTKRCPDGYTAIPTEKDINFWAGQEEGNNYTYEELK